MHTAAEGNAQEVMKHLHEFGVSYSVEDLQKRIPLHFAAYAGHDKLVDKLIASNRGLASTKDAKGLNALHHAVRGNQGPFTRQLLLEKKYGIDVMERCALGHTFLHHAVFKGAHDAVMVLVASGFSCEEKGLKGILAIHIACQTGNTEIFDLLLRLGANKSACDELNRNAYFHAAKNGHLHMLRHLEACQVPYENLRSSENGMSPLHLVTIAGFIDCVRFFLDRGYDPKDKTGKGKSALDFAKAKPDSENHKQILALLQAKLAAPGPAILIR